MFFMYVFGQSGKLNYIVTPLLKYIATRSLTYKAEHMGDQMLVKIHLFWLNIYPNFPLIVHVKGQESLMFLYRT